MQLLPIPKIITAENVHSLWFKTIRTDPVRKYIRMFDAENLVKKGNVVTVFTKFGLTAMYTTSFFCTTSLLSNDV